MKQFFSKISGLKMPACVLGLLAAGQNLFALAPNDGNSTSDAFITGFKTEVSAAAGPFIDLVLLIVGIIAIGLCVPALIKFAKGEHDSENALTKIGIGVIIAVVIIFVVKKILVG